MSELEVKNLTKAFGDLKAVNDISFSVEKGSIFGLLGRNGAGKTTTIRMLMNILFPDSGEVIFNNIKAGPEFNSKVGYLPEERGLYKKMKVMETLQFFAEVKGKSGKEINKKAKYYLSRFNLSDRANSKIEDLSKGNQQKVQFIATILHEPDILILDELFSGLDPINTNLLKEIILEFKEKGKVILFSTHIMDFAEKMCDNLAIMDKGNLVLSGNIADVKSKYASKNISLNYEGDISFLNSNSLIDKLTDYGNSASIKLKNADDSQAVLNQLLEHNVRISRFNTNEISLQDIFIEVAGNEEEVHNV